MDPSFNFGGWIELYNPEPHPVSLKGLYISDDSTDLKKSRFFSTKDELLPHEYEVFWFGKNIDTPSLISFNLDVDGGTLYISNTDGKILSRQSFPEGISRTSYARQTDGGPTWGYTPSPTPGTDNSKTTYTSQRLQAPKIDTDSRLFTEPFDIRINIPEGSELRYTLDGTKPTLEQGHKLSTNSLHISQTTLLRCRIFEKGKIPSSIVTRSYIYEKRHFDLPVVSVVTDPRYLYDDQIGIYVKGKNGKPGNGCQDSCNWNMAWNRPANIEYFTTDGINRVNQEAELCICGAYSRTFNPKGFKIKTKKKYDGKNYIPYSIFSTKPYIRHKTLQLRNGGGERFAMIKDAALQEIILSSGIDVDGQACQPAVHYLNGKYMGVLNIREPNNKDFAAANFGWKDKDIDHCSVVRYGYKQICGTEDALIEWHRLSAQAESPFIYQQILDLIDVDEFINYMAIQLYLGCQDFAKNNTKAFRPRIAQGRFRYTLHDLDSGMAYSDPFKYFRKRRSYIFHQYATGKPLPEEIKLVTIFFQMLKNDQFRRQFIDTFCLVSGSIFEQNRCEAIIDSLVEQRAEALSYEGKTSSHVGYKTKQRLRGRQQMMMDLLRQKPYLHLTEAPSARLRLRSDINCGRLSVNDIDIPTNRFDGELFLPLTLQANTPAGYRFTGWKLTPEVPADTLFNCESPWLYTDSGPLDGMDWKISHTNPLWKTTPATSDSKESPTRYFHKDFNLPSLSTSRQYVLSYTFNHGLSIYVNGKELIREKLPHTEIVYSTQAFYAEETPRHFSCTIPPSMLRKGLNHLAVEVHKISKESQPIHFEAQLTALNSAKRGTPRCLSTDETLVLGLSANGQNLDITACFEPVTAEERHSHESLVVINEISASNSIYINDRFKRKDWIELYNTTDEVIDLDGMYLSDKENDPYKYQIRKNGNLYDTHIQPHGYKIIWADQSAPLHQLHTHFKLKNQKSKIILTAADKSWNNVFEYGPHSDKHSVGRYPDGSEQLYIMTAPSIEASNRINTYAKPVSGNGETRAIDKLQLAFDDNSIVINSPRICKLILTVKSITGKLCLQRQLKGGAALIPTTGLCPGHYTAHIVTADGTQRSLHFVRD